MHKRGKESHSRLIAVVNACRWGIPLLNTLLNAVVNQIPIVSYGYTREIDAIQKATLRL
jgi:hypothetical protein